jgi:hypothetical protein
MALQPFVGPWTLLQFRNIFLRRRLDSLDEWLARRKAATYTQNNIKKTNKLWGFSPPANYTEQHKHRINARNADIHASSGIRTHNPNVLADEDGSCFSPRGHCNRQEFISIYVFIFRLSQKLTYK